MPTPNRGRFAGVADVARRPGYPSWAVWMRRWCVLLVLVLLGAVVVLTIAAPATGWHRWPLGTAVVLGVALLAASVSAAANRQLVMARQEAHQARPVPGRIPRAGVVAPLIGICVATGVFLVVYGASFLGAAPWGRTVLWWAAGLIPAKVAAAAVPAALCAGFLGFALSFVVQAWRECFVNENLQVFAQVVQQRHEAAEQREIESYQRGHTDGIRDRDEQYSRRDQEHRQQWDD